MHYLLIITELFYTTFTNIGIAQHIPDIAEIRRIREIE